MSEAITLLISSGNGPEECRQAVGHVVQMLLKEATSKGLECDVAGRQAARSVIVRLHGKAASELASRWLGTIQWTCKSSVRPKHKRQNWFVGVFELPQACPGDQFDEGAVRFESFRAGGPGGQHQNTTDSAVRATCLNTGVCVVARDGRSQHRNKAIALERLKALLAAQHSLNEAMQKRQSNQFHHLLERGNPVRRFKGPEFLEISK